MTGAGPGGHLEIRALTKRYGATTALADVDLDLASGSFTAVLGPSGCGKSTLLSAMAGLVRPDGGDIVLDGSSVLRLPPERRPVALVFQKPLLMPHLDVAANVGFGLRMQRLPRREIHRRVGEMLERVRLTGLGSRRVGELSGGQEQRAALARALVLSPRVLLLDEPFSALDAELRGQMRDLVRRLAAETGVTTVFVTHDQGEAVEVADSVVLLLDGRVVGHAAPEDYYVRPPTLEAARFFGVTNEIAGRVAAGRFTAPLTGAHGVPAPGVPDGPAVLVVRPERIALRDNDVDPGEPAGDAAAARLRCDAVVESVRFAGAHLVVRLTAGHSTLVAHIPVGSSVTVGERRTAWWAASAGTVFPGGST